VVGVVRKLGFGLLVVLVWQLLASLHVWPPILMPSPLAVAESLVDNTRDLTIPVAIGASMARLAIGYGIAVLVGVAIGLAISRSQLLKDTLGAAAVGLQSLPSVCWLPLALLWFGLSEKAIIFVVLMGALFSIVTAVDDGLRNVSPLLIKAGRALGARGFALQWGVVLPAAFPNIVTGLKTGWSFAWRSLMASELLYSERGLGRVLTVGRDLGDMAQVIGTIIVILLLGLTVNQYAFAPIERSLARRWGLQAA